MPGSLQPVTSLSKDHHNTLLSSSKLLGYKIKMDYVGYYILQNPENQVRKLINFAFILPKVMKW